MRAGRQTQAAWRGWRTILWLGAGTLAAMACSGRTDTKPKLSARSEAGEPGSAGAAPILLGVSGVGGSGSGVAGGPTLSAGGTSVSGTLDGDTPMGGNCDSPPPHACNDLQGYLEEVPEGAVDIELGSGDLTLLVIFDRSGSMAQGWDQRNKWQAASDSMIAGMAPYLSNLTIGAVLFPSPNDCAVAPLTDAGQIDFMPGGQFVSQWVESACAHQAAGSTPMGQAFAIANDGLTRARAMGLLDDRFRVVLVTDGEPNCSTDPEALVSFAAAWHEELGVETWVIGLPGSEQAAALLDRIAAAGGTEKHAQAGNPCEFQRTVGAAAK